MRRIEVGDKVLCVDARPSRPGEVLAIRAGETYTVTVVRRAMCARCSPVEKLSVRLKEVPDHICWLCDKGTSWRASRFIKADPNVEKEVRDEEVTA